MWCVDKFETLARYFGYSKFRPGQEELIDSLLAGRDVLGIMPTGGGKSLCYQIPALMGQGITLVISPLISLMQDQVMALVQVGAPAAYINHSLTSSQLWKAFQRMEQGRYKLVYVAPERLSLPQFQELCQRLPISCVTVDEAHCISQWGQDFRPDYLKISDFLAQLPRRPVVGAFTATATNRVKEDIISALGLQTPKVLTTGFDRPNLFFAVQAPLNKIDALLDALRKQKGRSGIVYCATRKKVEAVCQILRDNGYQAAMYHAGLDAAVRTANQEDFLYDRSPIMVATNAFGMGIDKSNVSFVIHYNMPKSLEAYYQEAGRAGRDGEPAHCLLLYSGQDMYTQNTLIENRDINPDITEEEREAAKRQDYLRLSQMKSYATQSGCLRAFILRYFGETPPRECGKCSNCVDQGAFLDITTDAQKILSCVKRSGERFGPALIADILHGDREDDRIERNQLDSLSTFGILPQLSSTEIRRRIRSLIDQGFLEEEENYHVLSLSPAAWEVLRGKRTVSIREVKRKERKRTRSAQESAPPPSELFERLRQLRLEIAREEGKPPFVIFSDSTLRDMCDKLPSNEEELLGVSGVGTTKLERYGKRFLDLLRQEHPALAQETWTPEGWTLGAALVHRDYGPCRVAALDRDSITVRFPDGERRSFLFPLCVKKGILVLGK